jgi:hypothetical protein
MSSGDRTPEERLASIETLVQARQEGTVIWRKAADRKIDAIDQQLIRADKKLDQIIRNGKGLVTLGALEEAFDKHVESCPARAPANPGPKKNNDKDDDKLGLILRGYRGLGIVGSMIALNAMLILVVMKLAGVF